MVKELELEAIGNVKLHKRKGMRSIRLSIAADGSIRVSMPPWVSYQEGLDFLSTKRDWIASHARPLQADLQPGDRIGKAHRLTFRPGNRISARLSGNEIIVAQPAGMPISDPELQAAARRGALRALKAEADRLLPGRVADLAGRHELEYAKVKTKVLKRRWGSCDAGKSITLNIYLMQLPWRFIDYVIIHELAHTRRMDHSKAFWETVYAMLPEARQLKREIKQYHPTLRTTNFETLMA